MLKPKIQIILQSWEVIIGFEEERYNKEKFYDDSKYGSSELIIGVEDFGYEIRSYF